MFKFLETAVSLLAAILFIWVLKRESDIHDSLRRRAARRTSRILLNRLSKSHDIGNEILGNSKIVKFPLMNLPPELRRMIWKQCLPPARLIEADDDHCYSPEWNFRPIRKDLNILQVCYESRSIALEEYQPLFNHDTPHGYFNPSIDIIHFTPGSHLFETYFREYHVFQNLRCIAILAESHSLQMKLSSLPFSIRGKTPLDKLILFGRLEKIYVVIEELARWVEVSAEEDCRLVPYGEGERGEDGELWDAVDAFREGLVALKEQRGLLGIPAVVPVRCISSRSTEDSLVRQ